ncbi:MAG: AAA domain-containing protein [Saprospiraceae bacterium]|nr:AAA domain-containing protein [Saprospiraceae bacterium]
MSSEKFIRRLAEEQYATELSALQKEDKDPRPENWHLSPTQVCKYILGGKLTSGDEIQPKYFGERRLVELAVATILTDRALLLIGVPGTAKTWLSEHLAAAISGDSTRVVQGTSGTGEDAIRYGWNYAKLLQEGPSTDALVPSPVMRAMQGGQLVRIEELTRIPSDIQDALITILSEKNLPVPELDINIRAKSGFNVVATANDRDRGVHELSSALQRRFNVVKLPLPPSLEEELKIVSFRIDQINRERKLPVQHIGVDEIKKLITVFRELRSGQSEDGEIKIKSPSSTLSTAEAISAVNNSIILSAYFNHKKGSVVPIAESIIGAVVKDSNQDIPILSEYLDTVIKSRKGWSKIYEACHLILK